MAKAEEAAQRVCAKRLAANRESMKRKRAEESQEQRENRLVANRESMKRGLRLKEKSPKESVPRNHKSNLKIFAWHSGTCPVDDYSLSRCVQIGTMSKICPYCKALKFNGETKGMCCASGKVKLPQLAAPPEPWKTLHTGTTSES